MREKNEREHNNIGLRIQLFYFVLDVMKILRIVYIIKIFCLAVLISTTNKNKNIYVINTKHEIVQGFWFHSIMMTPWPWILCILATETPY